MRGRGLVARALDAVARWEVERSHLDAPSTPASRQAHNRVRVRGLRTLVNGREKR